jgi:protoheme IX farnesyltransferase
MLESKIDNQSGVSWRDYLELCKPNVVALMLLTSLIGMLLATAWCRASRDINFW